MSYDATVVIPSYNNSDLSHTLCSLEKQNTIYKFEILIVDDGSDVPVLGQLKEQLTSFKLPYRILRQQNQGAAVARHVGAMNALGDIVIFVDAGDVVVPRFIQLHIDTLRACPDCVASIGIGVNQNESQSGPPPWTKDMKPGEIKFEMDCLKYLLARPYPLVLSMGLAVRKEPAIIASKNRAFFRAANDYDLQIRLAKLGKYALINETTHFFKPSKNGISSSYGIDRQIAFALLSGYEVLKDLTDSQKYEKIYKKNIAYFAPRALVRTFLYNEWVLFFKVLGISIRYCNIFDLFRTILWIIRNT